IHELRSSEGRCEGKAPRATAVGTACSSCGKAGKGRVFTPVRSSSGEYRFTSIVEGRRALARIDHRNRTRYWNAPDFDGLSCLCADFTAHDFAPHSHEAL